MHSLHGAISTDNGFTFSKFGNNPIKFNATTNDAVFYNNIYYIFYGTIADGEPQIWLSRSSSPTVFSTNPSRALKPYLTIDSASVAGARIFKVSGDSRWFMLYQGSSQHADYPDIFNVAYSSNLVNWGKVRSSTLALARGNSGEWDQGAIWTGEVFEHNGSLYTYYEGWGSFSHNTNRNTPYYAGGQSRVGIASVSVDDFLRWVNGTYNTTPPIISGSTYQIINRNSNLSLDIAGGNTANNATAYQWIYHGAANQRFKIESVGGTDYRITPTHSNKSLDVYGSSVANGGNVVQWDYLGGNNQKWRLESQGNGYYLIKNKIAINA